MTNWSNSLSFKGKLITAYDLLNEAMFDEEFEKRRAIRDDGYEVHLIMIACAKISELIAIINKGINNDNK